MTISNAGPPSHDAIDAVSIVANTMMIPVGPLREVERDVILATYKHCKFDKIDTCTTLRISLKTLYNRLHAYKVPLKPQVQLDLFDKND